LMIGIGGYNYWANEQERLKKWRADAYEVHLQQGYVAKEEGRYEDAIENYQLARHLAVALNWPTKELDEKITRIAQAGPPDVSTTKDNDKSQSNANSSIYDQLVTGTGNLVAICGTSYAVVPNTFQAILHQKATRQYAKRIDLVMHDYQYSLLNYQPILSGKSGAQRDYLANVLKCYPNLKVTLGAHLDPSKKEAFQNSRIIKFAGELKKVLIKKGVPAYQMSTRKFDILAPVPTNIKANNSPVRMFVSAD